MATDAGIAISAEDNHGKTPAATPATENPDRVKDSSTIVATPGANSVSDGSNKIGAAVVSISDDISDTEKKIRRAERFGVAVQLSEQEKRNSRAERFGTGSSSHGTDASKKSEELKRKARAERFGIPAPPLATNEEVKKKARLERFASTPKTDALEEDKRNARALRFSQPPASSLSINGKGNIEPKTAIAGKDGGGS